jgi:uncharacterized protein (TIGR03086 family)
MNDFLDRYLDRADRFGAVVGQVAADGWSAQSPCEKWTAADVVHHVVDTQRKFLARHDLAPTPAPEGSPDAVWREHQEGVRRVLGDGSVLDTEFDGYFGRTTIGAMLADFYGFDMVVHRWDLARAAGTDTEFTDDEMDLLEASISGFGDQLYAEGVCAPALPASPGASRQERILATLGRDAAHSPR